MDYDKLIQKLKKFNGKKITEKQLRDLISLSDYDEYFHTVIKLDKDHYIKPVKNSGPNEMNPPLYRRYTISME